MIISVITTMYNGKKYLQSLLENIEQNVLKLKSIHSEIEVEYIIVNDFPEEDIQINSEKLPYKLVIINNRQNCGIHESRAIAVKQAKGDFIQFLDQDDHITENTLLSQYENIGSADVSVANGYEKSGEIISPIYKSKRIHRVAIKPLYYYYVGSQIISPGQCLIKKDSIPVEWLSNFIKVNCSDDYLLWLLMIEKKVRFVPNYRFVFYHEITGVNLSIKYETKFRSNLEMCEIAKRVGSLSYKSIHKIESFTTTKLLWKSAISLKEKIILLLKKPDVFFWNAVYKMITI